MICWLPISMLLITILTGCTHTYEVVMSPQREEAFQAKVLDTDEKILLHRGGNWTLTKEAKDIRCFKQNDAEIVLTDKRILLVNTCSSFNSLDLILKWNYGDITELVLLTYTSYGSQQPFLVKFLVEDEKNMPIAIKIIIFPVSHADEVFSLIKNQLSQDIPTYSEELKKRIMDLTDYLWPQAAVQTFTENVRLGEI